MDVGFLRRSQVKLLSPQSYTGLAQREFVSQVGRALNRRFKPLFRSEGDVQVEIDVQAPFLLASILANLEIAGMGGRFPVNVTRALQDLIRTNAIEIVA